MRAREYNGCLADGFLFFASISGRTQHSGRHKLATAAEHMLSHFSASLSLSSVLSHFSVCVSIPLSVLILSTLVIALSQNSVSSRVLSARSHFASSSSLLFPFWSHFVLFSIYIPSLYLVCLAESNSSCQAFLTQESTNTRSITCHCHILSLSAFCVFPTRSRSSSSFPPLRRLTCVGASQTIGISPNRAVQAAS